MKRLSPVQRRARLGRRHHLAAPGTGPSGVVDSLVAVHSSDPATVYLSMWARLDGFQAPDLDHLLYEDRSLIRHWAMRRTLWVVPRGLLASMIASSTRPIGDKERKRTIRLIEEGGVAADGGAWLDTALPKTLEAIREHGTAPARVLTRQVPELADKIVFKNKAGRVMGSTGMASRALVQLGLESKVVRARPAGSWISGQYTWAVLEDWLGGPLEEVPPREASAHLVRRWLHSYGPATEVDLKWWTGWPVRQVRLALSDVGSVEVDLGEDGIGLVLPDDLEDLAAPDEWVAFLPSLDSTTMGWKERGWYLGPHSSLFDRNGNAGPTVWVDGRIVGGWAQRRDGEVVFQLLEDVGSEAQAAIERRRADLQTWLGDVKVTPRFRSPHDKSLAP